MDKRKAQGEPPVPGEQPKKEVTARVVGTTSVPLENRTPPKMRLISLDDQLTTEEWRQRFAKNLDDLLRLTGLSRKDAAKAIGIPYTLMRRLVSAGVSRTDERGKDDLMRIADFFTLVDVSRLWRGDLRRLLLDPHEGQAFIQKFRRALRTEWERQSAESHLPKFDELAFLSRALGFDTHPSSR